MKKIMSRTNISFLFGLGLTVGLMAPAAGFAASFDCTSPLGCTDANVNGALFTTEQFQPGGTGYIASFIRLHDKGEWDGAKFQPPPDGFESGANGGNDLEEKDAFIHNWNRILEVTADLIFNIGGTDYMSFWLDINETASKPLIDLTDLRLYIGPDNQYVHASDPTDDTNLVYGMDEGGDNVVNLDYSLFSGGSGIGDLNVLIPLVGGGAQYIGQNFFLYSAFGLADNTVDDGFEEWYAEGGGELPPPPDVPEPMTMLLFGTGLVGLAGARSRMNKK